MEAPEPPAFVERDAPSIPMDVSVAPSPSKATKRKGEIGRRSTVHTQQLAGQRR